MTVGELKAALAGHDDSTLVVLSEDSEGNGFSPLAEANEQAYIPDSTWSGDVRMIVPLTPQWEELGYGEEDMAIPGEGGAVLAVVLWPTR